MDDDDFERFFGGSPSPGKSGASQRKNLNVHRSRDEDELPINVYNNTNASTNDMMYEDQNDDITISDLYSYAPSTVDPRNMKGGGGDGSPHAHGNNMNNSSSPLIWIYNSAYSLFDSGRWRALRKKNDDLDENSIDGDTDYFATLMSSDFLSGSAPNSSSSQNHQYHWKNGYRKKKCLHALTVVLGLFFFGALIHSGDAGIEADMDVARKVDDETKGVRGKVETEIRAETNKVVPAGGDGIRKPLVQVDRSHEGMLLPSVFDNFAEVTEPAANTIPFFWHVPRTGGATMNDIFSVCHHLRVATNIGIGAGHDADTELQIVNFEKQQYVNVDISTSGGIQRAVAMGFASSDLTDVAISSLLHDSAPLFNPSRKGKMFSYFRHPVDRMVSMFYFMQDTVWKAEATYNKELAEISIENFFLRQLGENNWHVRFLTNQLTKAYVEEEDFKLAKEILRRKSLVGLLSEKEESMDRFTKHYGWKPKKGRDLECQKRRLQWDWSLRHPHEVEVLEGNRLWNLISGQNQYDMKLYEYAQYLFEEQSVLFP